MALPELDDVDRHAIDVCMGRAEGWRPPTPTARVPGVPVGWAADGWTARLRYVAAACEVVNPDRAAELRGMAAALDGGGAPLDAATAAVLATLTG